MRRLVVIENIEEMRRQEGIDDVQLREAIGGLRVGDFVKLTFLTGAAGGGETLLVRITCIREQGYRGKLVAGPSSNRLEQLRAGSSVTFTRDHIHSIVKQRPGRAATQQLAVAAGKLPAAGVGGKILHCP